MRNRRGCLICMVVVAVLAGSAYGTWRYGSYRSARALHELIDLTHEGAAVTIDAESEARIVAFCGDCHKMPRFDGFPRDAWHEMVWRGYEFYARSGRTDLDPPPAELTSAYFRSRAPRSLSFPEPEVEAGQWQARFRQEQLPGSSIAPAIAHIRWLPDSRIIDSPALVACDMRDGRVLVVDPGKPAEPPTVLARLDNPCHAEVCDLDGDQVFDIVVADLGSYTPDDHDRGRVVWLRGTGAPLEFAEVVLADGLGRVADARPADVDLDGDLDLVVAEFGLHATGNILLLRNVSTEGEPPRFESETIDQRPGTIHVPVCDLNDDGLPDFLALISQEYESVEAFINQGDGRFRAHPLWSGPDLTFGSSGIEPVDLDQDGDLDILCTNGDSFDNSYANPSHGVQWLENRGRLEFVYHRLTDLVGTYRALAGDVDQDGDLDVIAAAWLPEEVMPPSLRSSVLPTLVCLEQISPGVFVRHTLDSGSPRNASLEIADLDGDGDVDFVVGGVGTHGLTVWRNQGER